MTSPPLSQPTPLPPLNPPTSLAPGAPLKPPTTRYTSADQIDIHRDTAPNGEVIAVLLSLREQLARLTDGNALHAIVKAIYQSGRGSISPTTFDFDLCQLDLDTLRLIQKYVEECEQHA